MLNTDTFVRAVKLCDGEVALVLLVLNVPDPGVFCVVVKKSS